MNLRRRLLAILVLSAVGLSLVTGSIAIWQTHQSVREGITDRIAAETRLLAAWVVDAPERDPQDTAELAAASLGYRVTLIDGQGVVLGDSAKGRPGVAAMENHIGRPEVQLAMRTGAGQSRRVSASTGVEYYYAARLVESTGPVTFVRIALPASELEGAQERRAWLTGGLILAAMLLVALLAYLSIRRLSRPVELMARAAEQAAGGNFEIALPPAGYGRGEVARLAAAIRSMRDAILARAAETESERAVLASVIGGMREGLLVVGRDRRVELANGAVREILQLSFDPSGSMLAEVARHPVVLGDVETAFTEDREVRDSVFSLPGSGRSFELRVSPLAGTAGGEPGGVLVLFLDVTRLETLEGMRRDFVANVSHELRTPLTSIKAFVETLIEGGVDDPENRVRFLEIIRKHSDRMGDLIEDLTDLSLIETGSITLDLRRIDMAAVAREVFETLGPMAADRDVSLELRLPSPYPVRADRGRLEQVLTNLVSNAIKFNRPGGFVRIAVVESHGGGPSVVVEDSGEGIPSDSLEKIFHRFHRIDPSRSRELGGTGLGLAIVKHLLRLHGGQVRVESELGKGSRFYLDFPEIEASADDEATAHTASG